MRMRRVCCVVACGVPTLCAPWTLSRITGGRWQQEGAGAGAELLENAGEARGWESWVGALGDGPLGLGASGAFPGEKG